MCISQLGRHNTEQRQQEAGHPLAAERGSNSDVQITRGLRAPHTNTTRASRAS